MSVQVKVEYYPTWNEINKKWNFIVNVTGHPHLENSYFVSQEILKSQGLNIDDYVRSVDWIHRERIKLNEKALLKTSQLETH